MSIGTLLIACESSGDTDRISTALPALADHDAGRIVLLHVVEKIIPIAALGPLGGGLVLPPPPLEAERQWLEAHASKGRLELAQVSSQLPIRWPVRLRVEFGTPAETICRVAAEEQATVIVLACRRRSRICRWLFGRTTRRVLDDAPCNVLVLGPGAAHNRPGARQAVGGFSAAGRAVELLGLRFSARSHRA